MTTSADPCRRTIDAARAGMGLAYVTAGEVSPQLDSGELIRVLGDWTASYPGLCLYYSGRRHLPRGLRALVDLIAERRRAPALPRHP